MENVKASFVHRKMVFFRDFGRIVLHHWSMFPLSLVVEQCLYAYHSMYHLKRLLARMRIISVL
jgi:hypothetical protein